MNTSTKNEFKERMYAVIELLENKESAQIDVDKNYFNKYADKFSKLYLSSMFKLTQETSSDVLTTISWREIYESFEACADACENVSECIGSVIMKNT